MTKQYRQRHNDMNEMLIYKKMFMRIAEVWFDEDPNESQVDIVMYKHRQEPIPSSMHYERHTILIDLTQQQETLFSSLSAGLKSKIRRAQTEKIICENLDSCDPEVISKFCNFYNIFAAQKGFNRANHSYFTLLADKGRFEIFIAKDSTGEPLVYHAYYRSLRRATMMHSISHIHYSNDSQYRNMVGRANRLLHWESMLWFKTQGIPVYDLGGWYNGNIDKKRLGINRFKEEFGGVHICEFNSEQSLTWKGFIALWLHRLVYKKRYNLLKGDT